MLCIIRNHHDKNHAVRLTARSFFTIVSRLINRWEVTGYLVSKHPPIAGSTFALIAVN